MPHIHKVAQLSKEQAIRYTDSKNILMPGNIDTEIFDEYYEERLIDTDLVKKSAYILLPDGHVDQCVPCGKNRVSGLGYPSLFKTSKDKEYDLDMCNQFIDILSNNDGFTNPRIEYYSDFVVENDNLGMVVWGETPCLRDNTGGVSHVSVGRMFGYSEKSIIDFIYRCEKSDMSSKKLVGMFI